MDWPLQGLKVYGKSTQDGTPSPESPVPIVSAGASGSIGLTVSNSADHSQSLTISTPNGLPGIPVDSGGNYTDAEGQQWICDVVDFDLKSSVGNVAKKIFTGSEKFYLAERDISTNQLGGVFYTLLAPILQTAKGGLCNYYRYSKIDTDIRNNSGYFDLNFGQFRFSAKGYDSADDFKAHLKSMYNSGNPVTVFYPTMSIVNTALSPEELAAYRALHTYNGATVVSTAEDVAGLEVRYVADAQKYIDNRLAAAESHIQEIAAAQLNTQTGG